MLAYAVLVAFPVAMAFAALFDLFTMTIPNKISIALLALFGVAVVVTGMPLSAVGAHLAVGFAAFAVLFGMFCLGWIGGGDAKLWSVAALWMGYDHVLPYILMVSALGGALTLTLLAYRQVAMPAFLMQLPWAVRLHERSCGIPYGVALAGAAVWIYPDTAWVPLLSQHTGL